MGKNKKNRNWPLVYFYIFSFILLIFIVYKISYIQFVEYKIISTHELELRNLEATRGNILSEDGRILSITKSVYDIRLDLITIKSSLFESEISNLSNKLSDLFQDKSSSEYEKLLRSERGNRYFLLKRKVSYSILQELKSFPIFKSGRNSGGFMPEEYKNRDYPFGSLAKITVGRYKNGKAYKGIENSFNDYLKGEDGKIMSQRINKEGKWIPKKSEQNILPKPGYNVVSTINIEFQDAAEVALRKKLEETHALWGCAILMEVNTGEIKAIANLHRGKDSLYYDSKNHAIVSHIEPGSTFKLASLISLLEDGNVKLTDSVDTENGKYKFYDQTMYDSKKGGYGKITLADVFVKSSNVGISKLINQEYKDNKKGFISNLEKMCLTKPLELQLPFQNSILFKDPENKNEWSGTTLPWMSIGYELQLSPLHMLTFYNAIANNGEMICPKLVSSVMDGENIIETFPKKVISQKICSDKTIQKIMPILSEVVDNGTAQSIKSDKYSIAGKTGTCEIEYWVKKSYSEKRYRASFAGFFPAENPKYSCIVVVNDFTGSIHYGGAIAAPVFKDISDKVFALDSEMEYFSQEENNQSNFTRIEEKVNSSFSEENCILSANKDLQKGVMPNLKGIEIMDALFLLENRGIIVEFEGNGKVISQSVPKGNKINKGLIVELKLT